MKRAIVSLAMLTMLLATAAASDAEIRKVSIKTLGMD